MRIKSEQKIFFCTNTKMSKNVRQSLEYIKELNKYTYDIKDLIDLLVMPPYTALYSMSRLKNMHVKIGAQNVCRSEEIENTGEISAQMLLELGVCAGLVGHSERRKLYAESDEDLSAKVKVLVKNNMIALVGVGECFVQKDIYNAENTVKNQLVQILEKVSKEEAKLIRILYEPTWAIGKNGIPVNPIYIGKMHMAIRNTLIQLWGREIGQQTPVIYGGGINAENAEAVYAQRNVDGLGIGRSAWDAQLFNTIIRKILKFNQRYWEGEYEHAKNIK